MGVRTARRIGAGAFALWPLASLVALPTVVARADARGDWSGFAILAGSLTVVLLVLGASLVARFRRRESVAKAFTMSGWRLLGLIATGLAILLVATTFALGWMGAVRFCLAAAILAYAATAGTEPPPEGWAPRGEPWMRWLSAHWRLWFFAVLLIGLGLAVWGRAPYLALLALVESDILRPHSRAGLWREPA